MIESVAEDSMQSVEQTVLSWDFFRDLPDERDAFIQAARQRRVGRREILCWQGEVANSVFYISEGEVIVTQVSSSGKEFILYIYKKGVLVGSQAVLANLPRNVSTQSLTGCVVYEVQNRYFRSLVAKYPAFTERILRQVHISLNFMIAQYVSAFTDDAEIRLTKLLARLVSEELLKLEDHSRSHSIVLNITQYQLASAIGVSSVMVSRLLGRMQMDGLLDKSPNKISLLKPEHFLRYLEIFPAHTRHRTGN